MNQVKITKMTQKCIEIVVPSSRGGEHTVKYNKVTNKFTCTCEDYFYRERFCKHMKLARDYLLSLGFTNISETVVTNDNKDEEDVDVITELLNIKKQLYLLKEHTDCPEVQSSIKSIHLLLQQQRTLGEI